jgi:hypothetical protein
MPPATKDTANAEYVSCERYHVVHSWLKASLADGKSFPRAPLRSRKGPVVLSSKIEATHRAPEVGEGSGSLLRKPIAGEDQAWFRPIVDCSQRARRLLSTYEVRRPRPLGHGPQRRQEERHEFSENGWRWWYHGVCATALPRPRGPRSRRAPVERPCRTALARAPQVGDTGSARRWCRRSTSMINQSCPRAPSWWGRWSW